MQRSGKGVEARALLEKAEAMARQEGNEALASAEAEAAAAAYAAAHPPPFGHNGVPFPDGDDAKWDLVLEPSTESVAAAADTAGAGGVGAKKKSLAALDGPMSREELLALWHHPARDVKHLTHAQQLSRR